MTQFLVIYEDEDVCNDFRVFDSKEEAQDFIVNLVEEDEDVTETIQVFEIKRQLDVEVENKALEVVLS